MKDREKKMTFITPMMYTFINPFCKLIHQSFIGQLQLFLHCILKALRAEYV